MNKTSCCGADIGAHGPVSWNEFNRVVQCHNCGTVYAPDMANLLVSLYNEYCSAMADGGDRPGSPWTPERDNDEVALRVKAVLGNYALFR
jgi:hypothetical protein